MHDLGGEEAALRRGAAAARGAVGSIRPSAVDDRRPPHCPELDCLRSHLPPATLEAASRRAEALDVGADQVLLAAGVLTEDQYVAALAASLGIPLAPLEQMPRSACPLRDDELIDAEKRGLIQFRIGGQAIFVVAPRPFTARNLARGSYPTRETQIWLTSSARLRQFVMHHAFRAIRHQAVDALRAARPELSAAPRPFRLRATSLGALAATAGAAIIFLETALAIMSAALSLTFLAWTALRLFGAATWWHEWRVLRLPSAHLPLYSIIVALYDEADAVENLVHALRRLDYPRERLQIIFALEPDDLATREALERLDLRAPFEIVIAPKAGPRTKPKALNAALALVRGEYTAVFDAEDRPAPDQLHRALDAFLGNGPDIACVQARLTIDNTRDGWLARLFTAEYAALFDVLLPGLAARKLPLPLGGSSNHFQTAVLRDIAGGWDPYNVTEDADLGMRLARLGYRSAVISSTTYEEAPARISPWLRQRTRWFKGWAQTWCVHMRHPVRLARELGFVGFMTFQLVVGGTVLSALVHPFFFPLFVYAVATGHFFPVGADLIGAILFGLSGGALVAGYLTSTMLGLVGLIHRGLLSQAWVLLLMPVHWLLLSAAAWRALYQLVRDPYRWEKTAHGLARTSRLAAQSRVAHTIMLRSSAAGQPPRPRAAA